MADLTHPDYIKRRNAITVSYGPLSLEVSVDEAAQQAIDALVLEARIDERQKTWVYHTEDGDWGYTPDDNHTQIDNDDRIAQLKAELSHIVKGSEQ